MMTSSPAKPIDMLLFCPVCGEQHLDKPAPEKNWDNPPHRSHECQTPGCGTVWRPADIPTNGVRAISSRGVRDNVAITRHAPWRME